MTELTWDGRDKDGKKIGPVLIALPFQTLNETPQEGQLTLDTLFAWSTYCAQKSTDN